VEFVDSTGAVEAESAFAGAGGTRETFDDPRGVPILRVYGPAKNLGEKN
jgi:hypothetical protein